MAKVSIKYALTSIYNTLLGRIKTVESAVAAIGQSGGGESNITLMTALEHEPALEGLADMLDEIDEGE